MKKPQPERLKELKKSNNFLVSRKDLTQNLPLNYRQQGQQLHLKQNQVLYLQPHPLQLLLSQPHRQERLSCLDQRLKKQQLHQREHRCCLDQHLKQ